jgi:DNA polymerase-3 subunit delta'
MSFDQIKGQDRAVRYLKQSLERNKLHHAYLFSGMEGIGKKKTAYELAKALNCQDPGPSGGCGQCPACRMIDKNQYPDLVHIQPQGAQIKIEQIRQLNQQLSYGPALGRHILCLLDMASDLNEPAANAFLKTLEEPPEKTLFALLVRDRGELLPTLVSRCIEIGFTPLPFSLLTRILREEKGVSEEGARSLGCLSGGSPGKAGTFLDQDFGKIQETWINQMAEMPNAGTGQLLAWAKDWMGTREEMQSRLEIGLWCLRDFISVRQGREKEIAFPDHLLDKARNLAWSLETRIWLKRYGLMRQTAISLSQHANIQLSWEMLFFKMAKSY